MRPTASIEFVEIVNDTLIEAVELTVAQQAIVAGMRDFFHQSLSISAKLGKIVPKRGQAVIFGRNCKRRQGVSIDLRCPEGALSGDVQPQAGNAFCVRQKRGFRGCCDSCR